MGNPERAQGLRGVGHCGVTAVVSRRWGVTSRVAPAVGVASTAWGSRYGGGDFAARRASLGCPEL